MRALSAFLKKEWQEALASYRLVILIVLFALFGIMNVFTAKYTPEMITYFVSEEFAKSIPTPTLIDAWLQFFKNIGQIGVIVTVILFSGTLTQEYSKGTLTLLVTKGLSCWKIVTAKFLMNSFIFTLAYLSGISLTFTYGKFYFDSMEVLHLAFGLISLWLFTIFLIALINLGSVLCATNYLVLLVVGGVNVILMLLNFIPDVKEYNPISLFTAGTPLIQGDMVPSDILSAIYVTIGIVVIIKILTIILFNKKSL
ncbi:ABC transporter permease [Vagococcus fluvialis]|uniref:ABC transporter permease n=1 Tax=Vagococcus fluvialis TaxID=2738 RepID=UPI003B222DF8